MQTDKSERCVWIKKNLIAQFTKETFTNFKGEYSVLCAALLMTM
jgi:hypothetical protein